MDNAAAAPTSSAHAPILRIAQSPGDAWAGVLLGWFREAAASAWQQALPALVIVPTRAQGNALKARLLDQGISHLGLHFVTPGLLRDLLLRSRNDTAAAPEDLRLLLAIAAEEALASDVASTDEKQAAKAVHRAPDHLLRTLERIETAGWQFDQLRLRSFQPVVRRFRELLRDAGLALHAQADRRAASSAHKQTLLFSRVLVTGFDGGHWPHWSVLRAAVSAAEIATVLLEYPHGELDADSLWIGSWEEAYGEAVDVSARASTSSDSFFTDEEMRGLGRSKRECTFLVGADTAGQAQAVALQCVRFLAQPTCTRIGVVFAAAGSLPRLVATALAESEIPHNDGIGHSVPGIFESAEWHAWIELQQGPRINSLLRFINALPNRDELFPNLSMPGFERALRSAYAEVLIDDLQIIEQLCADGSGSSRDLIADTIRSIHLLPRRGPFTEFLRATEQAFQIFSWKTRQLEIARRLDERLIAHNRELSRAIFLRWLGEVAATATRSRGAAGEHPYARVQLLTVPEAQAQEWSHVIFAGWNEGSWPPAAAGEFVREDEIATFNRSIRELNHRASSAGRQGEGHSAVREHHSLYLGPAEQRQIALRQFEALLQSATAEVAFSASLVQEGAPERFWNPSELFTRVYQQTYRKPLTQPAMSSLQRATADWLHAARSLTPNSELASLQIEQTRVAYDARRDFSNPAGEYDFAFRSPPAHVPVFSVSELEQLVSAPAIIWMKKFLGVQAADESGSPWHAATGQWVHGWLAGSAGADGAKTFVRVPPAAQIEERIRVAAEAKAQQVKRLCARAGKPLPDWWSSGWQNALCIARHLGGKIATVREWRWMATEWNIEGDEPIPVGDEETLSFRGRIDLLLARDETPPDARQSELWILDYKTGSNKPLAPGKDDAEKRSTRLHNRLVKGEALQLGLYALAMRQHGAADVFLSIVSPAVRGVEPPQLSISDIAAHEDVFAELARMQQGGVFGMYGALRPAFGYTVRYPLATLGIDPDLLDAKWELTHPALAREEEEWESW